MGQILNGVAHVTQRAKHVKVNEGRLREFCEGFSGFQTSFVAPTTGAELSPGDKLQLDYAYNAVNFCYWGDPQWTVDHKGKKIHGAYGMKAAFNRGLEEGFPLLDPFYLASISDEDFAQITRGEGDLPLFNARVDFLRKAGKALAFDIRLNGRFENFVRPGQDAEEIARTLSDLSFYADWSMYEGKAVDFSKRAQLLTHNAHKLLQKQGEGLKNTDRLTALADYKVPQILRHVGILEYSQALADQVDSMTQLKIHSPEEVEIRAFTLDACERMAQILRRKNPGLEVIDLDHWLYHKSKEPGTMEGSKPYHRTLTTAY